MCSSNSKEMHLETEYRKLQIDVGSVHLLSSIVLLVLPGGEILDETKSTTDCNMLGIKLKLWSGKKVAAADVYCSCM